MTTNDIKVDRSKSFYVGDAAGRERRCGGESDPDEGLGDGAIEGGTQSTNSREVVTQDPPHAPPAQ